MKVTTITTLPSLVLQSFNAQLLSNPMPKFYDDSETLLQIYTYILYKLYRRCLYSSQKIKQFELLEKQFLELYERAKAKEAKYEKENGQSFQRPFDFFIYTGRNNKGIFEKIRFKCKYLSNT